MSALSFLTRGDDLGSSQSANQAIDAVTRAGVIKNVSVMAPCAAVEAAAELLAGRDDICFGMHTTLNSEWDRIKWGPVSKLSPASGLVDEHGFFLTDPSLFVETRPAVETIMAEVAAQLDRLTSIGFDIRYFDTHMAPELFIDGLDEALADFARAKGLIDHMYYYTVPIGVEQLPDSPFELAALFDNIPDGQYFLLAHPSLNTDEMRQTGNAQFSGAEVARARAAETEFYANPGLAGVLRQLKVEVVRYDEAVPLPTRLTGADLQAIMAQLSS